MNFRRALIIIGTGALLLFALISSLVISWRSAESLRDKAVQEGAQITQSFAHSAELALLYRSPENAAESVKAILSLPDRVAVGIYDELGRPLVERGEMVLLQGWQTPGTVRGLVREDTGAWYFAAPVTVGGDAESTPFSSEQQEPELIGRVRVVVSKASSNEMIRDIFVFNLAISLSFAVLVMLCMRWFSRWLSVPLEQLAESMARAEQGEPGVRARLFGPTDLKVMERSFNKMMVVLEEREAALKHARDAAIASSRAKAEFAATVSHEVRTPLNGVLGMLELLKGTRLEDEQLEYVCVAEDSGQSLLRLINDILDFSKIDAGKLQLEQIEYDLRRKVEDTVFLFSEAAHSKGLELAVHIDRAVPTVVTGDPTRIGQVLSNLLSNAIKFTQQGEVSVTVTPVAKQPDAERCRLNIAVADTGIGLESSTLGRIFDSFTQADGSTTRRYGGSGLGLTICKHLVEIMGGEIAVESVPGVGSTFSFTTMVGVGETAARQRLALANRRFLVVDEHELTCTAVSEMITSHSGMCDVATSGGEVLAMIGRAPEAQQRYDAILVAAALPDMGGVDLARYIQAYERLGPVPVVLIGNQRRGPGHQVGQAGVVARLPKPIRETQLLECLTNLLHDVIGRDDEESAVENQTVVDSSGDADAYRVLVVEDNHANQLVARGMLEKLGCEVDIANDGAEAVTLVERHSYGMVFMDCNMPGMDGLEATRRIRAAGHNRLPIIAMTANTLEEDFERCRVAGMDDFLIKPVRATAVKEALMRRGASAAELSSGFEPVSSAWMEAADLDGEIFSELQATLSDGISEVIDAFAEDAYDYLDRLGGAAQGGDWETFKKVAHNLKGSARNLGARRVGDIAHSLEEASRKGAVDLALAERELLDLSEALDSVQLAFAERIESWLGDSAAESVSTVLVVDDDRSSRIALCNALKAEGYRVKEAADGRQALRSCQRELPAIVLLDAVMPVQDGFRTCELIRKLPLGADVPILMITGLEDELSVERAFRAGAADFITKPVNYGVLRRRVARIMSARKSEQNVRRLAYQDSLTGLANRPAFTERVRGHLRARRSSEGLALVFLDLDQFKMINDTMGHDVGDELLISVARRLERCVRSEDIIARQGGDEFTLCLQATQSADDVVPVADKILAALSAPFEIGKREVFVTASMGIALYPDDGKDMETLVKHADTAMYQAKDVGGNAYHFYQADMGNRVRQRMRLEQGLRKAAQSDEFLLHYQPQIRTTDGAVIGAEALLRWRSHEHDRLIMPGEFIGLAEDSGLIGEIGHWVLSEACSQIRRWTQQGLPPLRISVNVSGRQLRDGQFGDLVAEVLRDTAIDPQLLEIEVTESVLVDNAPVAEAVLQRIKSLGVTTTIDDFGTGFSAMAYLKRFPLDVLKIDRSFLQGVPGEQGDCAITASMISLGTSLGMEVVAEGVESEAQLDFLRDRGCHFAQGTLIAPPLPADEFHEWLAARDVRSRCGSHGA